MEGVQRTLLAVSATQAAFCILALVRPGRNRPPKLCVIVDQTGGICCLEVVATSTFACVVEQGTRTADLGYIYICIYIHTRCSRSYFTADVSFYVFRIYTIRLPLNAGRTCNKLPADRLWSISTLHVGADQSNPRPLTSP